MDTKEIDEQLAIRLETGREVLIESFVFEPLYTFEDDPWLQAEPRETVIRNKRWQVYRMHGEPRHHVIEPPTPKAEGTPEFCVTAWLASGPLEYCPAPYSNLVVVFVSVFDRNLSFKQFFTMNLASLDWENFASIPTDWLRPEQIRLSDEVT